MNIQILDEAEQDLADGFNFYESREIGLGSYFLDSLIADIDSLQIYAGIHPVVFGFHRMLAQRLPYAIYYDVSSQTPGYGLCLIAGEIRSIQQSVFTIRISNSSSRVHSVH